MLSRVKMKKNPDRSKYNIQQRMYYYCTMYRLQILVL